MNNFGWSLPPGCGTLPGEEPDQYDNEIVKSAFADYDSPCDVYRSTYKYTACGPSVGFEVEYIEVLPPDGFNDYPSEVTRRKWFYCSDLHELGTWKNMDEHGILVTGVSVSSIVEGVDQCTDNHEIDVTPDALGEKETDKDGGELWRTLARLFREAVKAVNDEANEIWHQTHGCETCAKHWEGNPANWTDNDWDIGETPVWTDCPDCDGHGTVI